FAIVPADSITIIELVHLLFVPLFISCDVSLRDLHSFPTRRSSDLMEATLDARGVNILSASGPGSDQSVPHLHLHVIPRNGLVRRSEEHTSELQSRFDLVCRLLLEKKKKQQQAIHTDVHKCHPYTRT